MTEQELKAAIAERLTVPVWPHAGMALGLSKNPTYEAAKRGDIPTIRIGGAIRVPTAALRRMLEIDSSSANPVGKAA